MVVNFLGNLQMSSYEVNLYWNPRGTQLLLLMLLATEWSIETPKTWIVQRIEEYWGQGSCYSKVCSSQTLGVTLVLRT
jgi:hypothetical protein